MDAYGTIYRVTNTVNEKKYVGQTTDLDIERYWRQCCSAALHEKDVKKKQSRYLWRAIRKYGVGAWKIEKVCDVFSKQDLDVAEDAFIRLYDTVNRKKGYNCKYGGANGRHTEFTKRKIGDRLKGKKFSKERKKNMSEGMKKAWRREERVSNASLGQKRRFEDPKQREFYRKINTGRVITEETRRRLSMSAKNRSDEWRENKSLQIKAKWQDPEYRAAMLLKFKERSAKQKIAYSDEETKAVIDLHKSGVRLDVAVDRCGFGLSSFRKHLTRIGYLPLPR